MFNKKKQRGSSVWVTMTLVLVLIFAAITGMKLWAPYYDDLAVKTALENLSKEETTPTMSPNDIRKTLNKRLQVNSVSLDKDEVNIRKQDGVITIDVTYERRVEMYGNIDAIVSFNHNAQLSAKK